MSEGNHSPKAERDSSNNESETASNTPDADDKRIYNDALKSVQEKYNADILLFSAGITNGTADAVIQLVRDRSTQRASTKKPNVVLVLSTRGGNPHAAYRIARILQRRYENFTLLVFGVCKSAGTLIALGADKIVMSDFGELGPLDVQTSKDDDLIYRSSSLDLRQSLDTIGGFTYMFFENYFFSVLERGQGAITTKTAADIASGMASELVKPISQQIDPLQLGEFERAMRITIQYGKRLDPKQEEAVDQLASGYSSHNYVIDLEEAQDVFDDVSAAERIEYNLQNIFFPYVRTQCDPPIVRYLDIDQNSESDSYEESSERAAEGIGQRPEASVENVSRDDGENPEVRQDGIFTGSQTENTDATGSP